MKELKTRNDVLTDFIEVLGQEDVNPNKLKFIFKTVYIALADLIALIISVYLFLAMVFFSIQTIYLYGFDGFYLHEVHFGLSITGLFLLQTLMIFVRVYLDYILKKRFDIYRLKVLQE